MDTFSWRCPYCGQIATIGDKDYSYCAHNVHFETKDSQLVITTEIVVCPNADCRDYEIIAALYRGEWHSGNYRRAKEAILQWHLKPKSLAKQYPEYIPKAIILDYEEACLIKELSPKAAATLCRRCIQGIIRDYWGISKGRLIDEIAELEGKIDVIVWKAIDSVRSIGNIGAHMEKDINLIIDVDPQEVEMLIGLIELLIKDWYIARHEKELHLQEIIKLKEIKTAQRSGELVP